MHFHSSRTRHPVLTYAQTSCTSLPRSSSAASCCAADVPFSSLARLTIYRDRAFIVSGFQGPRLQCRSIGRSGTRDPLTASSSPISVSARTAGLRAGGVGFDHRARSHRRSPIAQTLACAACQSTSDRRRRAMSHRVQAMDKCVAIAMGVLATSLNLLSRPRAARSSLSP